MTPLEIVKRWKRIERARKAALTRKRNARARLMAKYPDLPAQAWSHELKGYASPGALAAADAYVKSVMRLVGAASD